MSGTDVVYTCNLVPIEAFPNEESSILTSFWPLADCCIYLHRSNLKLLQTHLFGPTILTRNLSAKIPLLSYLSSTIQSDYPSTSFAKPPQYRHCPSSNPMKKISKHAPAITMITISPRFSILRNMICMTPLSYFSFQHSCTPIKDKFCYVPVTELKNLLIPAHITSNSNSSQRWPPVAAKPTSFGISNVLLTPSDLVPPNHFHSNQIKHSC